MEELTLEERQIYDMLIMTKEVVEERVDAYRSSVTQAMSEMIKDNNLKFVCSTPRSTMP
jgi:hypothetical protein